MKTIAFLAALAGVQANAQEPELCARTFVNGDILEPQLPSEDTMPRLVIQNDNGGHAFVRLRGVDSAQLWTIYVEPDRTATIDDIVPGSYEILVAYRGELGSDCYNFAGGDFERFEGVFAFERTEEVTQTSEGTLTRISATEGQITLYEVENGNIETEEVSLEYFNQP